MHPKPRFDSQSPTEAFRLGVELLGGQSASARIINRRQSAISKRLKAEKPIWHDSVLAFEAATGISRHVLRPDIYPLEETPGPQPGVTPTAENEFQPAGGVSTSAARGKRS